MTYIPPEVTQLYRGEYNQALFLRFGGPDPLRLVLGFASMPIGIEAIDPDGAVYKAAGQAHELPDLDILINGKADQVTFSLSGVDPEISALIMANSSPVMGYDVHVGVAPCDMRWQPMTKIIPLWFGRADTMDEERPVQRSLDDPAACIVSLTVLAGETSRSKQALVTYDDYTQRQLHPGDLCCNRLARYVQGYRPAWPRY